MELELKVEFSRVILVVYHRNSLILFDCFLLILGCFYIFLVNLMMANICGDWRLVLVYSTPVCGGAARRMAK